MSNKKITDLPNKTTAGATDIVPIVDPGDNTTKRTTVAGVAAAVAASLPAGSVAATKVDPTSQYMRYTQMLTVTAIGTGGGTVNGGSKTFTAPFDGVCICTGSVPLRSNSTSTNDFVATFRLNGVDITGTGTLKASGRQITTGTSVAMGDTSPYARFPIVKGTSYAVTMYAVAGVNGSSAGDGAGWIQIELFETNFANAVLQ